MNEIIGRLFVLLLLVCIIDKDANTQPGGDLDRMIEEIEREMVMPLGAKPLEGYNRFYGFSTISERQVVKGVYLFQDISVADRYTFAPSTTLGAFKVFEEDFPGIADGGCSVVTVIYDLSVGELVWLQREARGDQEPQLGLCNGR